MVDLVLRRAGSGLSPERSAAVTKHRRRLQPWLLGLLIAVVVFAAALLALDLLGFGDDPVVEGMGIVGR